MIRQNLIKALVTLALFFVVLAVIGMVFEDDLLSATAWVAEHVGFVGMCLILLVTDTLVTPFPPDLLLVVVAHTELADNWLRYVLILGMVSVVAGMLGWSIGRWLGHFPFARRLFGEFKDENREFIRRYGFWAIAIGATTPLPFSATCWGAGILGIRWQTVLAAAVLFRIPRFVLYYWLIIAAGAWVG
jgi:membrane protein YqaA with SNARE-associated domain